MWNYSEKLHLNGDLYSVQCCRLNAAAKGEKVYDRINYVYFLVTDSTDYFDRLLKHRKPYFNRWRFGQSDVRGL